VPLQLLRVLQYSAFPSIKFNYKLTFIIIEAEQLYKTVIGEGKDCVIKAMVLTGGRGLGHFSNGFKGGVHLCNKPGDVKMYAAKMLGQNLITKQTTKEGLPCAKIMLAERMYMRREMYISVSYN
jgi:succinyl-CoA synthetase beta subunit